jgi:hypothetical protein
MAPVGFGGCPGEVGVRAESFNDLYDHFVGKGFFLGWVLHIPPTALEHYRIWPSMA